MKLWQKICGCSLVFFLLLYFCSGILMIEYNKKAIFKRILQQSADEQTGLSSGLMQYVTLNRAKDSTREGSRDTDYIKDYLDSRINSRGIFLEIRDENQRILYSNQDLGLNDVQDIDGMVTQYKIQKLEGREYLVLTSMIPLKNRPLINTYVKEISDIYMDRKHQYSFFLKLAFVISLILSTGMYLITGHFTKSLQILSESVIRIGCGNYKERVKIKAKDETGMLAESYNVMAEAIDKKIQELEQKNQEQQRFIDNFTHELRTPLTAVVGYGDLLRSTSCEEELVQDLGERIFRQGKRIEKLSELMMDLVFLEHHTFQLKPCEIGSILVQATESFEQSAKEARLEIKCIRPKQPVMIPAEKELLLELLINLMDNAKKASGEGGCIWIRGYVEAEQAVLEVEDQGKGIPEKDIDRVFESFYMADKARVGRNRGVGLGLSICADIVKIHNAQIQLASEEGQGTQVKIYFPMLQKGYKRLS